MSLNVTFNGSMYIIPETGEVGWGGNTTSYLVAIAAGALQKTGGSFLLSAETDFGGSFGLKSLYYKSRSANIAATGIVRLNNNSDSISWRNAANSGDLPLQVDTSNRLTYNGQPILTGVSPTDYVSSIIGTANQVIASSPTGNVTLSLPQAINTTANVQFGILGLGSATVASSILSLTSTVLGFLPPRLTTVQRDAIISPATGLFVYNTTTGVNNYYNGSTWLAIAAGGTINPGTAGFFAYYPATGTTLDDQALLSTNGTNISLSSGQFLLPSGTALLPPYSFTLSPSSGLYSTGLNKVGISANGVLALEILSTQDISIPNGDLTLTGGNLYVYTGGYAVIGSGSPFAALTVNTYRDAGGLTGPVAIDINGNFGTATAHPMIVETQHELAVGNAVAAYDSQVQIIGTNNTSHMVSFQSRANHASTGTLDILYGFVSQEAIQTGTVTDRYSYYVADASGAGTLVNNYGLYVENLVKGTTLRYAIFTAGTTPSYLGGSTGIGIAPGVAKLSIKSLGTNTTVLRAVSAADSQELFNVRENASGHGELYLFDSAEVTKVGIVSSGVSYFIGGETGFGTTTPLTNFKGIDVASGGITLVLGADNGNSTRTNATNKTARVGAPHYLNAEEQTSILSIANATSANLLLIGGGEASFNAATSIEFYTAANNTTLSGTLAMSILNTFAVQIFKTSNQLILGTTNTVTLSATAPAASRTWTLPDLSTNAIFAALEAAQTFTGIKTFSNDTNISATKKLFFDGGGDTYLVESSANVLDHVVGGTTILRETSTDVYTVDYTDYSATSTIVGFSAFTTKLIYYKKVGKTVTVWWQLEGTSNSTALTFTLPFTSANTHSVITCGFTTDNGTTTTTGGYALILKNTSTAILRKDMAGTTWTNTGTKEAIGQFTYQTT